MGNHDYETPESRFAEDVRIAFLRRQRSKYDRLVQMPADAFTVEQINMLRQFQPGPLMELIYNDLLRQTFFRRMDLAKSACYWRLHPRPWVDTSKGARILYDAVCKLWQEAAISHAQGT